MKEISLAPENVPLRYFRGDSWEARFTFTNPDDTPLVLTGYTVAMTVRQERHSPQKIASFSTANSTLTFYETNKVDLLKNWGSTAPAPGIYYYDVQITDPDGYVQTVIFGKLTIENDVTR